MLHFVVTDSLSAAETSFFVMLLPAVVHPPGPPTWSQLGPKPPLGPTPPLGPLVAANGAGLMAGGAAAGGTIAAARAAHGPGSSGSGHSSSQQAAAESNRLVEGGGGGGGWSRAWACPRDMAWDGM